MEAITYTSARQNMARLMDEVCQNSEVKIITRTNRDSVVMMSLEDYESWMETCYLMSSPENAKVLRESIKDLENGKGKKRKLIRR